MWTLCESEKFSHLGNKYFDKLGVLILEQSFVFYGLRTRK